MPGKLGQRINKDEARWKIHQLSIWQPYRPASFALYSGTVAATAVAAVLAAVVAVVAAAVAAVVAVVVMVAPTTHLSVPTSRPQ